MKKILTILVVAFCLKTNAQNPWKIYLFNGPTPMCPSGFTGLIVRDSTNTNNYYGGASHPTQSMTWRSGSCTGTILSTMTAGSGSSSLYQFTAPSYPTSVVYYAKLSTGQCLTYTLVVGSPQITINSPTICAGNTATLTATSAWSEYTYTWTTGSHNTSITTTPSVTTNYTVTANDYNSPYSASCASSATTSVIVNPKPTVTVNSGTICAGNSFTMVPSGANTYTFSSGSAVVTPTTTSSYWVTGTSTAGCVTGTAAISLVTVNPKPTITVNSGSVCSGQPFTMTPSGATTYTYSSGSAVVTPTINTTYSVTGTNANGCVSNAAISTVTITPPPAQPTAINGNQYICTSTSNTYSVPTVFGATSYSWSYPSGWSGSSISNSISTVASGIGGNLSVTANNICGNSSAQTLSISVFGLPIVTASASQDTICNGSSTTLTGIGANTYQWDNGNPNNSQLVSPTSNTTYTVTGTDVNNCVNTATILVTVNQLPSITYNQNPNAVCDNHLPFTLSTGFPTGGTYNGLGVTGINFDPSVSGTGTITITYSYTDVNGCSNSKTQNILVSVCTGVNELSSNSNQINIYPNPATSNLFVNSSNELGIITIYNGLGEIALQIKSKNIHEQIDISKLKEGIYTIQAKTLHAKFIKE